MGESFWHLWQLADSAFPTGGFAHSAGLEAALQQGEVRDAAELEMFLHETLWQQGHGALPLVSASYRELEALERLDGICEVFLSSHVANRSSRVQGRTFLSTCTRSLGQGPEKGLKTLSDRIKRGQLHQHYAPIFGAVMKTLGLEKELMQRLYLFISLRGLISAAIRLGLLGPYQAQTLQWRLAERLEEVLTHCSGLDVSDLSQTAPLLDLLQSNHDRLYSRLFQS